MDDRKRKIDRDLDDEGDFDEEENDENKKSKIDLAEVNEEEALQWLKDLEAQDLMNEKFFDKEWINECNIKFKGNKPFPYLLIEDFFDDTFMDKILEEISQEEMNVRSNDMFDFHQTNDLKTCKRPLIKKMREILYGEEFRSAMGKIIQMK
jgi:hypothetical protein